MLGGEQRAKGGVSDTVVSAQVNLIPSAHFFFIFLEKLTSGCFIDCSMLVFLFKGNLAFSY